MAQNYTSIPERSLAGGINQQASEDSIPDGYVENAINVTANTEGLIRKRPGFRTYLGHLPLRIAKVNWDHTKLVDNLTFELTSSEHTNIDVDLSNVASTAILVVGRTSVDVGANDEFNADYSYRYYTSFTANPRKVMLANTNGTLSYPQSEHGYTTQDLFVGLSKTDSSTDKSNSHLLTSSVSINTTTYDVSVGYENGSNSSAVETYVYALPLSGIPGSSYAALHSTAAPISGIHSITIPASTHNLNSFNILTRCYDTSVPGALTEVLPNEVYVDVTTGDVKLEFSEAQTNLRVMLHIPNIGNQYIDAIAKAPTPPTSTVTTTFEIPDLQGDFLFVDCFIWPSPTSSLRRRVIPTSVEVDVIARTATVTFENAVDVEDVVTLVWDYAVVKTTKLSVTAQTSLVSSGTDIEPELCIYGILSEDLYNSTENQNPYNGWVQHIDTYRTEGNTTLIAGMGWNLFRGMPRAFAPSYLATTLMYPSLRSRALNGTILAPAFHAVDQAVVRTRGGLKFTGGGEGWGQIQSITWNAALGGYDVVIPTPGLTVQGTPVQSFTPTQPYGDMLTLKGAELSSFEGDWAILSSIYVTSLPFQHVTFTIQTGFEGPDYNCGTAGEAGIFTDVLELETSTPLLLSKGDTLSAQSLPVGLQLGFLGYTDVASIRKVFVDGVVEEATLSPGQLVSCSRQNRYCYGLRNLDGSQTGFGQAKELMLVRGDSLEVSTLEVPLEVAHLVSEDQAGLTLTIEDGVGTLTGLSNARRFSIGQRLLLTQLGIYSGEFLVDSLGADNVSLTLDCTGVPDISLASVTIPAHFSLREPLSFSDDSFNRNYFAVEGRWECIEKPQIDTPNLARYALIEPTVTEHFNALDYGAQSPVRSTMSQDSLYLTNLTDPVQKYDGAATYRAGLPRWNAQLFITQGSASGATSTFNADDTFNYYFHIQAFDANESVVISAVTGAADYRVKMLTNNHAIFLRLLGFPNWDDYDYEKISLEIYRTKAKLPGEYFLVARLEMPQLPSGGYLDYEDILSDDILEAQGQDLAIASTYGVTGVAATLSEPLRAKYITSIDNRIVLANIRDWQRVELNFSKASVGTLKAADFAQKTILLRNDSADTGTVTDMVNRAGFYFCTDADHILITSASITFNSTTKIVNVPLGTISQTPQPGDWIYLTINGTANQYHHLSAVGWWQIRAVSVVAGATSVDIYIPNYVDNPTIRQVNYAFLAPNGTKHIPVYIGINANKGDNAWGMTGGHADNIIQITLRLAAAVNAAMRQVDIALPGYETFKPWIMADAGGEFPAGQINFVRPKESSVFFSVTLPTFTTDVLVASRGQYVTGTVVSAQRRFPSRILPSYREFPEVFNRAADLLITAAEDAELSPIDVNAADGQEITGIIPFFGESVISGSQREEQLVVFKTNSIYVVNISSKDVQKIQSNGLGCTAPYSIAPTKDGIMFANESGIYKLTRSQTVEPVGQFVDRIWQEEVSQSYLGLAQGHHYGISRQYKLSIPTSEAYNQDVLVYEHTRESRGQMGSWTRYTNHLATGWCNLADREYFATTQGRVCVLKNSGTKLDFSDRGDAITSEVMLRSTDFGIPNVRKKLLHLSIHFRNPREQEVNLSQESTAVHVAADLSDDFRECNKYEGGGLFVKTGLADAGILKGETIRFNVPVTKAIRFQPRITNSGLYETLEFSGVTYRVAGLTTKGTQEAKDTN